MTKLSTITVINKKDGITPAMIAADTIVIYIGRPSIFGNPFAMNCEAERAHVIKQYTTYMVTRWAEHGPLAKAIDDLIDTVRSGQNVALQCFCAPKSCHGDVIKALIEVKLEGESTGKGLAEYKKL